MPPYAAMPFPPRHESRLPAILAFAIGTTISVGLLLVHSAILVPRPGSPYVSAPSAAYQLTVLALGVSGMAVLDFAVGISVAMAMYQAVARPDTPEANRRGAFAFAAAFLVAWLVMSTFLVEYLASPIRYG